MKKLVLIVALALSLMAEMSFDQVQELIKKKQYNEALVSLDVIQKNHPNESIVYYATAQAKAGLGDLKGAKNALDRAKALNTKLTYAKPEAVKALEIAVQPRTELVQTFEREDKTNYWLSSFFGFVVLFGAVYYFMFRKKPKETVEQPKPYEYKSTTTGYSTPTREHSTVPVDAPSEQEIFKRYAETANRKPVRPEIRLYGSSGVNEVHHHHHTKGSAADSVIAGVGGFVVGAVIADMINDNDHITLPETKESVVFREEPKEESISWNNSNEKEEESISWNNSNEKDEEESWGGSNDTDSGSWGGSNE